MKGFKALVSMLIISIVFVVTAFCGEQAIDVVIDGFNPEVYFVTLAALVGAVLTVTQFVKNIFQSEAGWTVIISWFIALVLAIAGWALKLGIFVDIQFHFALLYGVITGMIANKIFDLTVGIWLYGFLKGLGGGKE